MDLHWRESQTSGIACTPQKPDVYLPFAERSWRPTPNPSPGDQDPALLTCKAVPPRGWGSGTLPSQLSLVCYLIALGPAPPSRRWDAAGGEKSGKELVKPWGPASLPSPPPIRGWRGRRHACALSASKRLQRGKLWWKEGVAEPPSWQVREQARSYRPEDPRKVHIWKDVVNNSVHTSLLFFFFFL